MSRRAAYVTRLVSRYQRLLGLTHWNLRVVVGGPVDADDFACYAAAEYQPEYMSATLYFDVAHPSFGRKEPIRDLVRHEVLHVALSPLARLATGEAADDAEETVVTLLERAPFWRLVERGEPASRSGAR